MKDKSGKINRDEIREFLGGGEFVSINLVDEVIEQADVNKDGEVISEAVDCDFVDMH